MFDTLRSLSLMLAITTVLALPALAQETTTEAPATDAPAADVPTADVPVTGTELSTGQPAGGPVEPYVKATYGDWQLRCMKTADGSDPCELYQLLKDGKDNSVAEITLLSLPNAKEVVAGATIIVPLETLLPQQLTLAIDGKEAKRYPFTFCAAVGCFSRIGFTAAEIDAMKIGAKATVSVVPIAAPDKVVSVNVSLKGFTEAFEAIKAETPAP